MKRALLAILTVALWCCAPPAFAQFEFGSGSGALHVVGASLPACTPSITYDYILVDATSRTDTAGGAVSTYDVVNYLVCDRNDSVWRVLASSLDATPAVSSVHGRTGAVVGQPGDYTVADIPGATASATLAGTGASQGAGLVGIRDVAGYYSATTVEAALEEVYELAQAGGGGGGATNLSASADASTVTVASDTGGDAVLPAATGSTAGVMTAADKTAHDAAVSKLAGIAAGATVGLGSDPAACPAGQYVTDQNQTGVLTCSTPAGGGGGATDLSEGTRTATTVDVDSSTGGSATLAAASTTQAGVMAAADKAKLDVLDGLTFRTLDYLSGSSTHGLAEAVADCEAASGGGTVIVHADGLRTIDGSTADPIPALTKCSVQGAGYVQPIAGVSTLLSGPSLFRITNAADYVVFTITSSSIEIQGVGIRMVGTNTATRCVQAGEQVSPIAEVDFDQIGCQNEDGTSSEGGPGIGLALDDWLKSSLSHSYVQGWDRGVSIGGTSASFSIRDNSIRYNDAGIWFEADLVGRSGIAEGNALEENIDFGWYAEAGSQLDFSESGDHHETTTAGARDVQIASTGFKWFGSRNNFSSGLTLGLTRTTTLAGRGFDSCEECRFQSPVAWTADGLSIRNTRSANTALTSTPQFAGVFDASVLTDVDSNTGCAAEFASRDVYGFGARCLDSASSAVWVCDLPNAQTANGICDDAAEAHVSQTDRGYRADAYEGSDILAKAQAAYEQAKTDGTRMAIIALPRGGTFSVSGAKLDLCDESGSTGYQTGGMVVGHGGGTTGRGGTQILATSGFASANVSKGGGTYTVTVNVDTDGAGPLTSLRDEITCSACDFRAAGITRGSLIETSGWASSANNYSKANAQLPLKVYRATTTKLILETERTTNPAMVAVGPTTTGEVRLLKPMIETCGNWTVQGLTLDGDGYADVLIHHRPDNAPNAECSAASTPYSTCTGDATGSATPLISVGGGIRGVYGYDPVYFGAANTSLENGGQSDHWGVFDGSHFWGGLISVWYDGLQTQPGVVIRDTQLEHFQRAGFWLSSGSGILDDATIISADADCRAGTYGEAAHVWMSAENVVGISMMGKTNIETKCGNAVHVVNGGSTQYGVRFLSFGDAYIQANDALATDMALLDAPDACLAVDFGNSAWLSNADPTNPPTLTIGNSHQGAGCDSTVRGRPRLIDSGSITTDHTPVLTINDGIPVALFSDSTLDDDRVAFDDADSLWTASTIGAALEELNDSINAGTPNGTGAKVHWSQLLGVPAGFADGTDDGADGGGAPTDADYLVGTANGSLSAEIVFGTAVANQWVTGVSGGAITRAQPDFSNLSGTATDGQIPAAIARDSEVAAGYQPLAAILSDLADGTIATNLVNTANPWAVNEGGSGAGTFTANGALYGNGTSAFQVTAAHTANGSLLIGDGSGVPSVATLTGTANEIEITNGPGSIQIGIPDSPVFVSPNLGAATADSVDLTRPSGTNRSTLVFKEGTGEAGSGETLTVRSPSGGFTSSVTCDLEDDATPFDGCVSGGGSTNSFETIDAPSGTDPVADTSTDTLTLTAGTGMTITGDSSTDTLAFALSSVLQDLSDGTATSFTLGTAVVGTTQSAGDNSTKIATTAFARGEINAAGGAGLACSSGVCALATSEGSSIASGTAAPANDGALVIDTDGDGSTVSNDVLGFQSGSEDFFIFAVREYPTTDGQVIKYNSTNHDVEWAADSTGGTPAFNAITTGVNTGADMTVGAGANLIFGTSTTSTGNLKGSVLGLAGDVNLGSYGIAPNAGGGFTFEGLTANAFEIDFLPTDPTADRTIYLPDADTKIPISGQFLTFSGPSAARTITLPDANATMARTDAAQTFTGTQTFGSATSILLGTAGSAVGTIGFRNATSGTITVQPPTGALGTVALTLPAATDTLVAKATADILTNKTLNAESTGNLVTIPERVWFPAAGCNGTTAAPFLDLPTSEPAGAACVTGTNTQKGVLDFEDGTATTAESAQFSQALPADWTGAIDLRLKWLAAATTGNVVWNVATICVADAETDDPAFNAASSVTDAAKGTTLQTNDAAITGVTATGCAAGEMMHVKVSRDADNGSDTMTGDARLIGVELTYRRAM